MTINRRFSSEPNPIDFFAEKKAKEAIERGEFTDIHDIGGVDPEDHDVIITDMSDYTSDNIDELDLRIKE